MRLSGWRTQKKTVFCVATFIKRSKVKVSFHRNTGELFPKHISYSLLSLSINNFAILLHTFIYM